MNRKFLNTDDSWENDAVWKLLDQAPPAIAGPRFVTNTVRAARLMAQTIPFEAENIAQGFVSQHPRACH